MLVEFPTSREMKINQLRSLQAELYTLNNELKASKLPDLANIDKFKQMLFLQTQIICILSSEVRE